jgi:hypothetical protein
MINCIICGSKTKDPSYDYCEECFNTRSRRSRRDIQTKRASETGKDHQETQPRGLSQVSQAITIFTTRREIKSRSSEKEERKMEEQKKIIAYRIGESLFCPECYEKTAKVLKAVQNPEDPQVTLPSKPIKAEDIHVFACNQCGVVRGSVQKKSNTQSDNKDTETDSPPKKILEPRRWTLSKRKEERNLIDLEEILIYCGEKLALVQDLLASMPLNECPEISEDGSEGVYIVLDEIKDDLDLVINDIDQKRKRHLIIDTTEQG